MENFSARFHSNILCTLAISIFFVKGFVFFTKEGYIIAHAGLVLIFLWGYHEHVRVYATLFFEKNKGIAVLFRKTELERFLLNEIKENLNNHYRKIKSNISVYMTAAIGL